MPGANVATANANVRIVLSSDAVPGQTMQMTKPRRRNIIAAKKNASIVGTNLDFCLLNGYVAVGVFTVIMIMMALRSHAASAVNFVAKVVDGTNTKNVQNVSNGPQFEKQIRIREKRESWMSGPARNTGVRRD